MLYHTARPADWKQDSFELRVANKGAGPFSWVAGMYYWDSSFEIRLRSNIGFAIPGKILDIAQFDDQTAKSYAALFRRRLQICRPVDIDRGRTLHQGQKDFGGARQCRHQRSASRWVPSWGRWRSARFLDAGHTEVRPEILDQRQCDDLRVLLEGLPLWRSPESRVELRRGHYAL